MRIILASKYRMIRSIRSLIIAGTSLAVIYACFVFATKKDKLNSSVVQIRDILQKEFSEYRPLRLMVDVKFGENLGFLKNYSEI